MSDQHSSLASTPDRPSDQRPLVVASNRLPVRLEVDGDTWTSHPSSGGLVTALQGVSGDRVWVGWPGCSVPETLRDDVRADLAKHGLAPVFLDAVQERLYYRGFSNSVLWPLFHYSSDRLDYEQEEWEAYVGVNEIFAQTLAESSPDGAMVWVQDFHLMLVPAMLRVLRPDLAIGFFLHIPFPSSELYRLIPRREELLLGLLGADQISFHTSDYARHFRSSCVRVLGLDVESDELRYGERRIGIGVHPIGIDTEGFREKLADPETAEHFEILRERYGQRRVLLGVERLDYSKGIRLKLAAYEHYLEQDPDRIESVVMLQVLVPSRLNHPEYQSLKDDIEGTIGRINGRFGRPGLPAIDYMHRTVSPPELVAMYRYASAGLVTPIRDGMNLVAQEFVLCQAVENAAMPACQGILVLSEFAGAAHSLSRSILVNPWNCEQTADAIDTALAMDPEERRRRMTPMAKLVEHMKSSHWAARCLESIAVAASHNRTSAHCPMLGDAGLQRLLAEFTGTACRHVFLDYDGTLREIVPHPEDAVPSRALLELLERLGSVPGTTVHVVSGRLRGDLEQWLGHLPVQLCAEHGFARRAAGETEWHESDHVDLGWMPRLEQLLRDVTQEVPGSFIEVKPCSVAWHYRLTDVDYGPWRARELRNNLKAELSQDPIDILPGRKVLEVRAMGVHKGRYVQDVLAAAPDDAFVLCAGDDRTDMDLYRNAPESAWTIHVGGANEEASTFVESPATLRDVLAHLVRAANAGVGGTR